MSSDEIVIDVRGVSKRYDVYENPRDRLKQIVVPRLIQTANKIGLARHAQPPIYHREFWALQELSFQVRPGETLGIIGRNGSGKSTLLQIIAGTLAPTHGEVTVTGRVAALLELGSGFNPEFTGRENVLLNARILGLSRDQIAERYDQIAAFADIGDFIDQPVKTYSSGMFVRLAFAVQAHIDASIVIIDEALAVGDVFFRQKCYARLEDIRASGAAVLLVSHAMTDIEQFCDRAILLDHGKMLFAGDASEAAKRYYQLHQTASRAVFDAPAVASPAIVAGDDIGEIDSWPDDSQFVSAEGVVQVGNGWARCTRFAVCNAAGVRSPSFEQGEEARFYSEFVVAEPMGVPLTGIVLQNDRGLNVHGKGSLEYAVAAPHRLEAGTVIRCRQTVKLQLELGEYTFELGLATIDAATYAAMSTLNHEQIFSRIVRVCHLPKAGFLAVGWRRTHNGPPLTHHGLADLPGSVYFDFNRTS
ncbi:ABC transporter ATP-binding protein [Rhodopseudomonas palustris]|uniref:ABC transporter ATP-binding protein n=1 Tax=Rhodopseudomonas palustris TaxID=1076 RepID=A0A323U982_RHOPL|nr:ABC transporter ATP-binding protein [Rhodopseudomonas palustris]PZA09402.1 ABC transporter ATP-binding protein [Rhodopseudomonas palustris]